MMKRYFQFYFLLVCCLMVSCSESDDVKDPSADEAIPQLFLENMRFTSADNPNELIEDVVCEIIGDSIVECWVPNMMESKLLIPSIATNSEECLLDSETVVEGISRHDFKAPVKMELKTGEVTKEYTVYVHSFTGLPVMWIETEGREEVVSKEDYLNAHFKLIENVTTRSPGDIVELDGQIRGRGNSTWELPKKPYRLKFNEKVSFLDESADKSWVLLANYTDKTAVRNATALYMGSISNLEYTPRFHYVELMFNGRYSGTYQLGDKIKIGKNRVNVGDDGFLMEVDARAVNEDDARYFYVEHLPNPVNIKDPDVEYDDDDFNYAKAYVEKADAALFSDNFMDPEEGWQKYIDMDSFVDWYLINEIAKNNDGLFFSSCFMNLKRDGKLKMGPIWDYDISFGNINYDNNFEYEGFWIKHASWFARLFQDPAFVARVKERFDYFYSRKDDIMTQINENAQYLKHSVKENDNRWHTFYVETWPNYDIWGSYMNEVQSLKTWLSNRFEWLNTEIHKL